MSTATAVMQWDTSDTAVLPTEQPLYELQETGDVRTNTPRVLRFERDVIEFHRATPNRKGVLRKAVVDAIREARLQARAAVDEYVNTMLEVLIQSPKPGRLGDAIDVLSQLGEELEHLTMRALLKDGPFPDEDYLYVLVRALGKLRTDRSLALLRTCSRWSDVAVREAAVEALNELEDRESLMRVAREDSSEFIRNLAAESLAEWND